MIDKNAFLIELSESERTDFGNRDFQSQSDVQKVFSAIWALESEVNNGGFHQFFLNCAGQTANFAPTALRTIGAATCAELVERALRCAAAEPLPVEDDLRRAQLEQLSAEVIDALEELDGEFYEYPDDLTALLFDFVHAHPEAFGSTPR